jgi:molybdate transport system ATP-binding protein
MSLTVDVRVRRGDFTVQAEFDARENETVALLGPNGAGKSTLLECVAGILEPERGRVTLGDEVLDEAEKGTHVLPEKRPIGVVFQGGLLFPHLSAGENVAFPLRAHGLARADARQRARVALEALGIGDLGPTKPGALSGGQRQLVALARSLVGEPRLLLLDEPLSALDVRTRAETRAVLRSALANFQGVRILVTHDPIEAMTLADRMVLIEEGAVTQIGTPAEFRDAPRSAYGAEFVGLNLFQGTLERPGPGVSMIATARGTRIVAAVTEVGIEDGHAVVAFVRPADISLHLEPPEGSARNILEGAVGAIAIERDRARVRIASEPPVVAEVTHASVERLELEEGTHVWASFKAVEVRIVSGD